MPRISSTSGIAIGPILFIIALLGILAAVMSTDSGGFSTAGVSDRVATEITSQANLIRSKINECNLLYSTNENGDGWPASTSDDGTLVTALECTGDPDGRKNIWTGLRVAMLAPPPKGFDNWLYINKGDAGGRCIWTVPTGGKIGSGEIAGLDSAKNKFSSQEVSFDHDGVSKKFVIFITRPIDPDDMDDKCKSE